MMKKFGNYLAVQGEVCKYGHVEFDYACHRISNMRCDSLSKEVLEVKSFITAKDKTHAKNKENNFKKTFRDEHISGEKYNFSQRIKDYLEKLKLDETKTELSMVEKINKTVECKLNVPELPKITKDQYVKYNWENPETITFKVEELSSLNKGSEYIEITPKQAYILTKLSGNERTLRTIPVKLLANEIIKGNFRRSNDMFCIHQKGNRCNGNHRSNAMVLANKLEPENKYCKKIGINISYGYDDKDVVLFDTASKRNDANRMEILGLKPGNSLPAINRIMDYSGIDKTTTVRAEYQSALSEAFTYIGRFISTGKKKMGNAASRAALCLAYIENKGITNIEEKLEEICQFIQSKPCEEKFLNKQNRDDLNHILNVYNNYKDTKGGGIATFGQEAIDSFFVICHDGFSSVFKNVKSKQLKMGDKAAEKEYFDKLDIDQEYMDNLVKICKDMSCEGLE